MAPSLLRRVAAAGCAAGVIIAAAHLPAANGARQAPVEPPTAAALAANIFATMDRSASPCNNFYRYACGGYIDSVTPLNGPIAGRSFPSLADGATAWLVAALSPGGPLAGAPAGNLYASCIAEGGLEGPGNATKDCLDNVESTFPDELAVAWVAENVDPADTAATAGIWKDTVAASAALFASTPWMDAKSAAAAAEKLADLRFRNGVDPALSRSTCVGGAAAGGSGGGSGRSQTSHPGIWDDDTRATAWTAAADRWYRPPYKLDASYSPRANVVTLNSAIQRWPFLPRASSAGAPAALDYGGVGVVAGHEIGHAFDSSGVVRGAAGRYFGNTWLTPPARAAFQNRTGCVTDLYGRYTIPRLGKSPVVRLDGAQTLDENMADLFGLRVAAAALRSALAGRLSDRTVAGTNPALAAAFSDEQLFYVAAAQTWCIRRSKESLAARVADNPHAPARLRVVGPMSQSSAFAAAFQCPVGAAYHPADTCEVYGE